MEHKKIIIIGSQKVGKTRMIKRLISELKELDYINVNDYKPTIGVDIYPIKIKDYNFILWDCSGDDKYDTMRDAYWEKSKGAICIIDLDNKCSFNKGKHLMELFIYKNPKSKVIPIYTGKNTVKNTRKYNKQYVLESVDDVSKDIFNNFL